MHVMADAGGSLSIRESGAMQFFCMQGLGIMVEDIAQGLFQRYFDLKPASRALRIGRLFGYLWVPFFLIWTSPVWVFPVIRNMQVDDALLSLGAVKPILLGRETTHYDY